MVPFCRRVEKAGACIDDAWRSNGLKRGENGLEIYVMCEIPNNVIQIDAFAELFDGFSIGSNDLTQLTLGVDRDSEIVAFDFDERDPGMLEMLQARRAPAPSATDAMSASAARRRRTIPRSRAFLPQLGIDSISVNSVERACARCRSCTRPSSQRRAPSRPSNSACRKGRDRPQSSR